jgi:hypothetical protein
MKKEIICRLTGLTKTQMNYFQQGVLKPDNPRKNKRQARDWSAKNLVEFLVVRELADYGIARRKIKEILWAFKALEAQWWNEQENKPAGKEFFLIIYKGIWKRWQVELKKGLRSPLDLSHFKGAVVINLGLLMLRANFFRSCGF